MASSNLYRYEYQSVYKMALTYQGDLLGTYTLVITYPDNEGGGSTTVTDIPAPNVLTANGTLTIGSVLAGNTYVIPPGSPVASISPSRS